MKKFLIVVDMQRDFVDGALGTNEAQGIVENVVRKIEGFDGEIIVTYDTHGEDYMQTAEGRKLPVPHCIRGSQGWQIREELEKLRTGPAVDKPTFGSQALGELLLKLDKEEKIGSITLVGLCTDICVISNALILKAAFPEADVYVNPDLCAGSTPANHAAALQILCCQSGAGSAGGQCPLTPAAAQ